MARLAAILDEVKADKSRGRVVILAGEAGIGKSRLVSELEGVARAQRARFASGAILDVEVPHGEDAVHQVVEMLLGLPREPAAKLAALEARLPLAALRPEQWPFLYHFLGSVLPGAMERLYAAMDPRERLSAYRDMLGALFTHEARQAPLVIVVEDLHWADPPTLEVVDLLAGLARTLPVVVVLTTRVEGEERWKHRLAAHALERIELVALGTDDARELAACLGVTDAEQLAVLERAGGHPLLLTELARGIGKTDGGELPRSVQGLVHARLDRLPPRDRTAIQGAAVLGPRFTLAQLRELVADPDYDCGRLYDYRLLRDLGPSLGFVHALVRDAVYVTLVEPDRVALHERCAKIAGDDHGLAAMHLERAGSPLAAGRYLAAARHEAEAHRSPQAIQLLSRALAVATDDAMRAQVYELRGSLELLAGKSNDALASYDALRALARDDDAIYRAEIGRANALRAATRLDDALAAADLAEAPALRAGIAAAELHHLRGAVYFSRGRLAECKAAHDLAVAAARATGDEELCARALSGLADAHYASTRVATAATLWQECIEMARARGFVRIEAINLPMLAIANVFLDKPARGRELALEALELARSVSYRRAEALALGVGSLCRLALQDYETAEEHAREALEMTREIGSVPFEQTALYYLAHAQLGLGRPDDARASLKAGLALCDAGTHFVGAALLATSARLEDDRAARERLLDEGARALARAPLSFNVLWYHDNAIEASLAVGDSARAKQSIAALEAATADEPLAWAARVCAAARRRLD